jgi:hypothetical protein
MKPVYVVIWLKHSGIELHASYACEDPEGAVARYEAVLQEAGLQETPSFGSISATCLEEGRRFSRSNGQTTVHAFRVQAVVVSVSLVL